MTDRRGGLPTEVGVGDSLNYHIFEACELVSVTDREEEEGRAGRPTEMGVGCNEWLREMTLT